MPPTPSRGLQPGADHLDRPFFYAVLRLDQLDTMLQRLEILPQAEIGALVNLAVLAQAVVIAVLVLLVPLAAPRRLRSAGSRTAAAVVYFPALGLGFLFIEIFLIEKASLWLNDRTVGLRPGADRHADVLRAGQHDRRIGWSAPGKAWHRCWRRDHLLVRRRTDWPAAADSRRRWICPGSSAPAWCWRCWRRCRWRSACRSRSAWRAPAPAAMLPWAWGLNGAFSVVATPLANLIAREAGFSRVLFCAAILYVVALMAFPVARTN